MVTRAVSPGSAALGTVFRSIKKQVNNQQVRMVPAKLLRAWEVLGVDIPDLD